MSDRYVEIEYDEFVRETPDAALFVIDGEEIWKDIAGYEERYQVSNLGNVRSVPRVVVSSDGRTQPVRGRLLKPWIDAFGYQQVTLSKFKSKKHKVHRLVLEAFVGPCPEGMECLHGPDPRKTNNALTNLRWGTHHQNMADSIASGIHAHGERHGSVKLTESDVRSIRATYELGGVSLSSLGRQFRVHIQSISNIVKRKTWRHIP